MALETLKNIDEIDSYLIIRGKPFDLSWEDFNGQRKEYPIFISEELNQISFKIQKGPVEEVGLNGCQVDTMIECAKIMLEKLSETFPCRENALAIIKLDEALHWLDHRKKDRQKRGCEGYSTK